MPAIVAAWPAAVGETIARNAWPARVARDGTLHINTASSTWAFELSHLAQTILERLRDALEEEAPASIRFAPGRLPEPAPPAPRLFSASVEPSPEEVARGRELASAIDGEELREHVARAAALSLSRTASGRPF
jgi:hypothetical protein